MTSLRSVRFMLVPLIIFLSAVSDAAAQRFSVSSFRQLPNDVSAFINPVRDLNDEDCGLLKIIASEDFAFSTPLGIVKREDKVGEIWLYLPRGSKKITIKHPEWGVMRDYAFPDRIVSHMTYEMRIYEPVTPTAIAATPPVVTTVTDTLVVTRVDTLVVAPVKKRMPLNVSVLASVGYGGRSKSLSGGIMAIALKRHGAFVHVATDFGKIGAVTGECDKTGNIAGSMPFYTGRTRQSSMLANAGLAHRLTNRLTLFEGLGYSKTTLAWELAPSEGGGYVKNTHYSTHGISFETGVEFRCGKIAVSASVISIKGTEWFGTIGVGIKFGK